MNLQELLKKLKEIGMTDRAIGVEIGASQSIVTRLRLGQHKSCSYERGIAIKKLVLKKCPNIYLSNDDQLHNKTVERRSSEQRVTERRVTDRREQRLNLGSQVMDSVNNENADSE